MVIGDMKVCPIGRHSFLHLLFFPRCFGNALFYQRFSPERPVPFVAVQQTPQDGLAFCPEDRIDHSRIAESDIIEANLIHRKGTTIHVDGVTVLQIVGKVRHNRLLGFSGDRNLIQRAICQVNDDLPHSRQAVMLRDNPLIRVERRSILRCRLRFPRYRFSHRLLSFLIPSDRSHIRFHLLNERIPGQGFGINQLAVHNSAFCQARPDRSGVNIVQTIIWFLAFRGRALRKLFFCILWGACRKGRISGTRGWHRKPGIGERYPHFSEACLFRVRQVRTALYQAADMLLHSRPAQLHFLPEATPGEAHALAVVIHKAAGAVQVCMTVAADTVFVLQERLRVLRRRMAVIESSDSQPAALKARAPTEDVVDLLIGNRKRRDGCLCAGSGMGLFRFCLAFVDSGDLLSLCGNQE